MQGLRRARSTEAGDFGRDRAQPAGAGAGDGLITVRVAGWPCETLQQRLWDQQRIITNVIREQRPLRFSLAFFTSQEELDIAAQAIAG